MAVFVSKFCRLYDGDRRIAFVQAGLLGDWGEWHTFGRDYLSESFPDEVPIRLDWAFTMICLPSKRSLAR
jgi:hypothetical protein